MGLLTPNPGLLLWMLIVFGIVFFVLAKYGFPAMLQAVNERKAFIDQSLQSAREANARMEAIQAEADTLIADARKEQGRILAEAMTTRDKIVKEAEEKAKREGDRLMKEMHLQIETERNDAMLTLRRQVSVLAVGIAEKVLREKLNEDEEHLKLIDRLVDEMQASSNNNLQ